MRCLWFVSPTSLGLIFIYSVLSKELDFDYDLERTEAVLGIQETAIDFGNTKIIKKNKRYFLNGTFTIEKDIDNNYLINFSVHHSPMGNSQFMKTPFKIPSTSVCDFTNTTYKNQIQPALIGKTNLPFIPSEGMCPIPKGTYYFKEVQFPDVFFPPHVSSGLWKIDNNFVMGSDVVGGLRIFIKVTSKLEH